jgi:hypothetical protein
MPVLPIALVAIVAGLITYDIANKDEPLPPTPIMSSTSTEAPVAVVDQPVTTAPVPTPPEPPRKERKKAEKKPQACK